jgi:hypothetical protein
MSNPNEKPGRKNQTPGQKPDQQQGGGSRSPASSNSNGIQIPNASLGDT